MSEVIKQDLKTEALKLALDAIEKLWNIIDDIDTYGDMAKADEKLYRSLVERRQRTRFEETGISTDGHTLNGGAITAIREALAEPDYKALYEKAAQQYNELAELMENAQGDLERVKLVQTGVGIGKPEQDYLAGVPPMLPQMRDGEKIVVAQPEQEPEFITHSVDQPYDWSDWVCPDPKSYLMKCCDCGLVHEAQFGVVRYKSEIEREDCDMVDDPNLQAVFRMRRSEQWSPEDTAHRAGGLPMEQPAQQQEPVAWLSEGGDVSRSKLYMDEMGFKCEPLYKSPPQRKPLTDEEIWDEVKAADLDWQTGWSLDEDASNRYITFARAIEAAHGIKEKRND